MTVNILILSIIIPAIFGIIAFVSVRKLSFLKEPAALIATFLNLIFAIAMFGKEITLNLPWGGYGFDFNLRLYHFSAFIILASSGFSFLITLYSAVFMKGKNYANQFYSYLLLSVAMVNGAVLADNLVLLLFFWEALLLTLFGMILIGSKDAHKTAVKALIIAGITDLCMMFGIALTYYIAGTFTISKISIEPHVLGSIAFVFLMIGAISKAGSMPFHSWIPDAAVDAPLPFMAFLPASLEKLLGIYFLARISLDMYKISITSPLSMLLMVIGVTTILLAVMMALIQKDFKKLLSYHAISQVGYMILGIGTALPVGIVGGIFHMINHAMYKSCLFLTGGSVEKQAGTTELKKLGGLGAKMPVTFVCFIIAAAAISGVPPFNGFFSKELVYDGALERHWLFYALALLGSFFTAASFLKLGHSAFLGKISEENKNVKEAHWSMLVPMIVIASFCVLFGLYNSLPINKLITPIIALRLEGAHHSFSGMPSNVLLIILTLVTLAGALLNHLYGVKKSGSGLGASDHIHYAPGLSGIYDRAEKRFFDPYDIGLKLVDVFKTVSFYIDRLIDLVYNRISVDTTYFFARNVQYLHGGNYSVYLAWSLVGIILMTVLLI
ncbi:MAG: NADH-quinone oxidoreductase subunit L [Elusimicrobia bacterium]|nr:NADH-quinone oxidoreductase subunit L [Candidatus Liberimonas magnetica]